MTDLAIEVKDLHKQFADKTVVKGVSLSVPSGQVWGFLGPNGSGKTTTIRMICGLLRPSSGEGRCLGHDIIREAAHIKRQTGYMTQKFSFWEDLTIRENLQFVARMYRLPNGRNKVDETLERLGLVQRHRQLAGELSGGWKQRLALAAVTMHEPRLLLLDEPTSGVDPQARREFWDQIHQFAANGMTILVSTHYMDEAERCDQIAYLANGQLLTQGKVRDVISDSRQVTYRASGDAVRQFSQSLKDCAGVQTSAYYGSALHVSGTDEAALRKVLATAPYDQLSWQRIDPGLEDVFISLMKQAGTDNRAYQ